MSVVGFDIGNLNCYIAVARQGGIEVITNDYSLHATPACVSFGAKHRQMGVAARQGVNSNFKNTIMNFKHLIGRKYSDPITQKFLPFIPCGAVQLPNDNIGIEVTYLDKREVFTPEQIFAALITKLREIIEFQMADVKKVTDCVVAVPYYYTDTQRRAVQAALHYAGLNPLRILNETTAIALAYGIYKQDLPEDAEGVKARNVVFLDVGHSNTQASIAAFNKGKVKMIGAAYDLDVGGLWFDKLIAEHFRTEFKSKYNVDAHESPRAWLRLLDESEKVKKQMSANQTPIPINIECFMNDKDVTGKMQRAEFEELAAPLFDKIRAVLNNLMAESKLTAPDIDEIEIVGGSSRIPMIRQIIRELFGKEAKTTMNQDEAVARGAAMQCAILSPAFRVREFAVKDCQPYKIKMNWHGGAVENGESDVFVERDEFPFSKVITLYRQDGFQLDARYALPNAVPHNTAALGTWKVHGVTPDENGGPRKVKVKVRINPNGIFAVCNASISEIKPVEPEKVIQEPEPMEQDASNAEVPTDPVEEKEAKPKTKTITTELKVEEILPAIYDIKKFTSIESAMQESDRKEKVKADAKNNLEEYVYEMREKLCDQLSEYVEEGDADAFRSELTATEDWLYDEGEDTEIKYYEQRLNDLKKIGDPIVERFKEGELRIPAFDAFDQVIMRARKDYENYCNGGASHAHLDSKDMEKVINAIEEKKKWLDEMRHKQERKRKTEAPAVFVNEIQAQKQFFDAVVRPILDKKPPPPPTKAPEPPKEEAPKEDMEVD